MRHIRRVDDHALRMRTRFRARLMVSARDIPSPTTTWPCLWPSRPRGTWRATRLRMTRLASSVTVARPILPLTECVRVGSIPSPHDRRSAVRYDPRGGQPKPDRFARPLQFTLRAVMRVTRGCCLTLIEREREGPSCLAPHACQLTHCAATVASRRISWACGQCRTQCVTSTCCRR